MRRTEGKAKDLGCQVKKRSLGSPVTEIKGKQEESGVSQERKMGELTGIIKKLPSLGDDSEAFTRDVEDVIRNQPPVPKES